MVQHADIDHTGIPGTGAAAVKACRVTRNADQSISSGGTAISWDNEVRDDGGFWASSPNPTRLTAPDDGWYMFAACANAGVTTSDSFDVRVHLNGTNIANTRHYETTNSVNFRQSIAGIVYMTAGQYLELFLDVGATQTVIGETTSPGGLQMSIAQVH